MRNCLLGCGLVILLLVTAVGLAGWYIVHLWRTVPAGWQQVDANRAATTPQQRSELAAEFEKRVLSQLSRIPLSNDRPATDRGNPDNADAVAESDAHRIAMSNDEINAWLEHRLPLWAANQGLPLPEELESVRFWSEDRQPVLASQVTIEDISQIISVSLDLKLRESGDAIVKMGRIRGGRLTMPQTDLIDHAIDHVRARSEKVASQLAPLLEGHAFDPVFPLDRQRQARLTGYAVDDDGLTLRLRTEPLPDR